jgi:AcrR family transcriptional regulator
MTETIHTFRFIHNDTPAMEENVAVSPQHSNRQALIEGTLRCVEARPSGEITAREIAAASDANLASIRYHFGSKDALVACAIEEGFRRWLKEVGEIMGELPKLAESERIMHAFGVLESGLNRHRGLVRVFFAALARAPQDGELRAILARSYADSRRGVATLLKLGEDEAGIAAASLVLATFDGLLVQALVDETDWPEAATVAQGIERLRAVAE